MKARILTVSVLFAVVMVFTATSASAQGLAQHGRFLVPFDFSVGENALPAGEYTVIRECEFIRLRSKDGKHSSIVFSSRRIGARQKTNEAALTFRLDGAQYQLSQVWLPDGIGRELRNKRKVDPTIAKNVKTVQVTAGR